jgi:hypothetical protein
MVQEVAHVAVVDFGRSFGWLGHGWLYVVAFPVALGAAPSYRAAASGSNLDQIGPDDNRFSCDGD